MGFQEHVLVCVCVCVCVLGHLLGSDFHYQGRFSANTPVTGPPDLTVGTPQAKSPTRGFEPVSIQTRC